MQNYGTEIARLQRELLDNVDDYVREQADAQLRDLVEAEARRQVTEEVENAALEQVTQMRSDDVQKLIRQNIDAQMQSDDVHAFYDGLRDYTDGVTDLRDGAQEMKDGTDEFRSETENINDTIREKIDDMIAEKTGSDVQVQSFIDPRNTDVENVQFVITTPSVHVSDAPAEAEEEPESTGILQKIRDLFR